MTDEQLIACLESRDEEALVHLRDTYGAYCDTIAHTILDSKEDCEECLSDVWMRVWNAIPPAKPHNLKAYTARITRNVAYDRIKTAYAQKRGRNRGCDAMEEWAAVLPATCNVEDEVILKDLFDRFLKTLPKQTRVMFIKRYWFMLPIERIAADLDMKEDRVKTRLLRTRRRLKAFLEKEGVTV